MELGVCTSNQIVVYFSKLEGCTNGAESKGEGHLAHFHKKNEVCLMLTNM